MVSAGGRGSLNPQGGIPNFTRGGHARDSAGWDMGGGG